MHSTLLRPHKQHNNTENMYLKLLTPFIEKIMNLLHGIKFINQKIRMYYLVSVDHNGITAHLTRNDCEGSYAVVGTDDAMLCCGMTVKGMGM